MKATQAACFVAVIFFLHIGFVLAGQHGEKSTSQQDPLTPQDKGHYESLAKSWTERLWATNVCYRVVYPRVLGNFPSWMCWDTWEKIFKQSTLTVYPGRVNEKQPWRKRIVVEFGITTTNRKEWCAFNFLDRKSDKIQYIHNSLYSYPNVPYQKDGKPLNTTEQQARQRAEEYAAAFGVSNLWDETRFMLRSPSFTHGTWTYSLTPNVNGYPTLYAITISLADLPGLPLGDWLNDVDQIPTSLPTNVVLTAGQARAKAEEYLKRYFPLKEIVPKMTFNTNCLEYISPNYNYIRPSDETGFSNYAPKEDEVALVWSNYFDKPRGLSFSLPAVIYVDAATGEMLGGAD